MIDWQQIDQVFLDMDGTLLDLYFDNHFWLEFVPQKYAQLHQMALEDAREYCHGEYKAVEGTMAWYCVDHWSDRLGLDIAGLKREISHLISVHPHVPEFLDQLRETGRKVVLVTNAHRRSLVLKMEKTALAGHFDQIVCAHDFGNPKEEQAFWSKLQESLSFDVKRTLFVDDSEAVLRSARRFGFRWLLGVQNPDTRGPEKQFSDFDAISDFSRLMPVPPRSD